MDRAKQIFLDALDLPVPQRDEYLKRACDGDESLRTRVAGLIAAHEQAHRVIVEPTIFPWSPTAGGSLLDSVAVEQNESPGATVGEYVIERVLGEGGFGVVYLARQEQPVQRRVALKIMHRGMATRDFIRRFELERQALAVMDHPGIAKVYDAGETPAGSPYFAMEYVDGPSITEFADANRLSMRHRLELFERVCQAVQHAHSKGVIHRDLKPSNVLVTRIDGRPFPKIIDFGIAKAADEGHHLAANITRPHQIIGTPQYMAPEQATLTDVDIDTRADVYSLGAILYELLCGAPVFSAARLRDLRPSELEKIICEEEPPRPSARVSKLDPTTLSATAEARGVEPSRWSRVLSGDLDWICMRALEKDRSRRYPTALSLAEDVRRYLRDEPVEACPPTLNYRFVKFARRHRVEFAAAATVALALAAFAVGSAWFAWKEHHTARDLERQLRRANALTDFSQDLLAGVDPAEARGLDTALMKKILAGSIAKVESKLADQPEAAVAMLNAIGYAHLQIGDFEAAERTFLKALARGVPAMGNDHDLVMQATENLAATFVDTGRFAESERLMSELLETRRRVLGPEDRQTLLTASNRAVLLEKTGRWHEARAALEELLPIRERVLGKDHPDVLTTLNNLANCLDNLDEGEKAIPILERVLDAQLRTLGEDHPKTLHTMNNLASSYRSVHRLPEARELYEKTLHIKFTVHGPDHPSTMITRMNLAAVYLDVGELDRAQVEYEHALKVAREKPGPSDPRVAALNGLALISKRRGDLITSADRLAQAVEAAREAMGPKHPVVATLLGNLASVRLDAGQFTASEQSAREALALIEETLGLQHAASLNPRRMLARALAGQQRFPEAADTLAAALQEIDRWPPDMFEPALLEVARYYDSAGDTATAARWRARAPTTQPTTQPSTQPQTS